MSINSGASGERQMLPPMARCTSTVAPIKPNTAPEAPTVGAFGAVSNSAPNAPTEHRHDEQRQEPSPPEAGLEHLPEDPEDVHVEGQMEDPVVQERRP